MRRLCGTLLIAALLAPPVAAAPGLNLGWNLACPTTAASAADMAFPCNDNTLLFTMVASVRAPAGISMLDAEELTFDLKESSSLLSPWWHFEDGTASTPGGCRGTTPTNVGSLSLSSSLAGASTAVCKNYWGTSASGAWNWLPDVVAPGRARLQAAFGRQESTAGPLVADDQYYLARIDIDSQHSIADPTDPTVYVCAGCQDGMCIVFSTCRLDQPPGTPGGDITIIAQDFRQFVTWQGGVGTDCPAATPTHRATWGELKSLYR